ncbi:MAG: ECF transporter S component [Chloroflexi bacterium]|nr:ECF transporter S component [Chloroflexota bacterium]
MNTRENVWSRSWPWAGTAQFVALLALAVIIPNLGMTQLVTGSLVNALLLLTVLWSGVTPALLLGMVTPLGAALRGVLPLPLWMMIPFIAMGNALYSATFGALRRTNRWLAVGAAAAAKFLLLYGVVTLLVSRPLNLLIGGSAQSVSIPASIATMMQWPQLATALIGGAIALSINWAVSRNSK